MARKKKCRGGVCALQNLPKKSSPAPKPARVLPQITRQPAQPISAMIPPVQQQTPLQNLNMGLPVQPNAPFQAPLQQLGNNGWYNPYAQQQQPMAPVQQQPLPTGLPSLNPQATAIPQGQVMHPTGKQRGSAGRFFLNTRPQVYNNPLYTQYQNDVLNYISQFGLEGIADMLQNPQQDAQFNFAPIGNQELERFYTQTVPSLAERFTALGDGQRSSAFQGALANAGRFLGNDLAAQQQQYNIQQQQMAQQNRGMNQNLFTNLLSLGLRPQFESNLQPGKGGLLPGIVNEGAQVAKAFI